MPYVANRNGSLHGVRYAEGKVVAEGGPLIREDLEYLASEEYKYVRWEDKVDDEQIPAGVWVGSDGYAYDDPESAGLEALPERRTGAKYITRAAELGIEPGTPAEPEQADVEEPQGGPQEPAAESS